MSWTIGVVLIVLWTLGIIGNIGGVMIHALLVILGLVFIFNLVRRHRVSR